MLQVLQQGHRVRRHVPRSSSLQKQDARLRFVQLKRTGCYKSPEIFKKQRRRVLTAFLACRSILCALAKVHSPWLHVHEARRVCLWSRRGRGGLRCRSLPSLRKWISTLAVKAPTRAKKKKKKDMPDVQMKNKNGNITDGGNSVGLGFVDGWVAGGENRSALFAVAA